MSRFVVCETVHWHICGTHLTEDINCTLNSNKVILCLYSTAWEQMSRSKYLKLACEN